jgi:bifunctional non-homologous end joining protein LigD
VDGRYVALLRGINVGKAKRVAKIFIDYFRNDYTATAIADYSVRARPGAPVATPIDWKELKSLKDPGQFTIKDVLKRLKNKNPDSATRVRELFRTPPKSLSTAT